MRPSQNVQFNDVQHNATCDKFPNFQQKVSNTKNSIEIVIERVGVGLLPIDFFKLGFTLNRILGDGKDIVIKSPVVMVLSPREI